MRTLHGALPGGLQRATKGRFVIARVSPRTRGRMLCCQESGLEAGAIGGKMASREANDSSELESEMNSWCEMAHGNRRNACVCVVALFAAGWMAEKNSLLRTPGIMVGSPRFSHG
jgi:hypothetical protein